MSTAFFAPKPLYSVIGIVSIKQAGEALFSALAPRLFGFFTLVSVFFQPLFRIFLGFYSALFSVILPSGR
jgi:hypothetical protein